ncbi:hypothetical protein LP419_38970 [Massilia sp. H-1]|nr:hypothetical protein LP419_38970 [Massilia sp. H-1]
MAKHASEMTVARKICSVSTRARHAIDRAAGVGGVKDARTVWRRAADLPGALVRAASAEQQGQGAQRGSRAGMEHGGFHCVENCSV